MTTTIRENNAKTASKIIVSYLRENYDYMLNDKEILAVVDYLIGFDRLAKKFVSFGFDHENLVAELCFDKAHEIAAFDGFFQGAIKFIKGI
jgi:hypothetical protein